MMRNLIEAMVGNQGGEYSHWETEHWDEYYYDSLVQAYESKDIKLIMVCYFFTTKDNKILIVYTNAFYLEASSG